MTTLGDTKWQWTWRKDAEALAAFKARQIAKGMTIRVIAEELGISKSTTLLQPIWTTVQQARSDV